MIIGVPKEIKNNENRVAMTPASVYTLVKANHQVVIETLAGVGSGFSDESYKEVGATIVETKEEVWACEMVMKVKEPLEIEYDFFKEGLVLFTYLHLAAEPILTKKLLEKKVTAIAYETVEKNKQLPLLTPMSEVAGRMATQLGAQYLQKFNGGMGILLSGVPGVSRGEVTIIGGGVVGINAAKVAIGLGAKVTILDVSPERLRYLDDIFKNSIQTLISNSFTIAKAIKESDLVIGAVLIPGAKAPKLVTKEMVQQMKPGSVIVDVAVDQGGIFETVDHVTTHDHPIYERYGVLHYAVANMPGAVPRTSTYALTNATIPFALEIANKGLKKALRDNESLLKGVNVMSGFITYEAIAKDLDYPFVSATKFL